MLKKIIIISIVVLLLAYLAYAILILNPKAGNEACRDVNIVVIDTLNKHFISDRDISVMLKNAGMTPIGKSMKEIDSDAIEKKLSESRLIKKVECYKTTDGIVKIEVYQKIPILRVISNKDGSYCVDNEGKTMPITQNFSAYLPIATGFIEKEFATTKLFDFALFLQENKFWDAQIEQINVIANKEIELTPRVGDHQILLGTLDDYPEKLEKLKLFYEKGLNEVGWNKYSVINLKYKNQVVCTKKTIGN